MMPLAIFRVDASEAIGTGHVMRCLTLATALRERGTNILFVCRMHAGNLCTLIEDRGFQVSRLPLSGTIKTTADALAHAHWLGSSWEEDAAQTRAAIDALDARPDWLVVDHYALDHRWEDALRGCVGRILVIDDLADRGHGNCLLLDQNMVAGMTTRYAGKVPEESGVLLGPGYALLQPGYAALRGTVAPRMGPVRRLFVYFGGVDVHGLTARTMTAFLRLQHTGIDVDVVVSGQGENSAAVRRMLAGRDNIHVHEGLTSLALLMAKADLAVGACGVAAWERLCLGLPAIVVTVAENQRPIAEELGRRRLIQYLGHHDNVDAWAIENALGQAIAGDSDGEWSKRCLLAVDGRGTARVCAVMTADASTSLRARCARAEDEAQLLEWANDKVTRRNAFSPQAISADTHRAWFQARLRDVAGCRLFVVETEDGMAVGTVRFERGVREWEVHFSLSPLFRGRGLGRRLLETAMITPPVGINLYVVQGLRKRGRIDDVIIGTAPFVVTLMLMIVIISVFPGLAMWLPKIAAG